MFQSGNQVISLSKIKVSDRESRDAAEQTAFLSAAVPHAA
jgi:hypothetical protein